MSEVTVTDGGRDRNVHEPLHRGRNSAYQPMSALIKSNVVVNVLYGFWRINKAPGEGSTWAKNCSSVMQVTKKGLQIALHAHFSL